jgi:parvulin-like peptidyl-prolyl isomerase
VAKSQALAKTCRAEGDDAFHARKDYLPQIADVLATLKVGEVSPVLHLPAGFVVVKVVAERFPENREARAEARKTALAQAQQAFLKAHGDTLRSRYVTDDKAVLDSIDFEKTKMDALLKDTRVVARIKGGPSVTVGDLADYLRMQFFHGSDNAKQGREMNGRKAQGLEAMLGRRLLNLEAQRLGIERTNEYRDRVRGYEESLVFNTFVEKVIAPENKMQEDEVKRYYNAHLAEYSYPEMVKLRSLAFTRADAAERAARKLREGTDFAWIAANADGQADRTTPGLLTFDGQPVMRDSMPAGLQKALAGAKANDLRVYASPGGPVYVLAIQQVIAPGAKPYDEVREVIAKKLYGEKLQKGIEAYAGKLRAQAKVSTYLKKV